MAGKVKLGAEAVDAAVGLLKEADSAGKLADLAQEANIPVQALEDIIEKGAKTKAGKSAVTSLVSAFGEGIESLQGKVNSLLGRESTALVPVVSGPLAKTRQALGEPVNMGFDATTGAPMSVQPKAPPFGAAAPEKLPLPPPGRREETLRESLGEAAQVPEDLGGVALPKMPTTKQVAGTGAALLGGIAGLNLAYKNYVQRPEAQQQIPSAVAAEVEGPEQLATVVDNAAPAMEPEKAQQLQAQAKEVLTLGQQLEKALARERDAEKKEKDRLAMFRLIDKIADGVATAMGSYALLQRGSPFAVDFSKGPKIDWDARYNSIQKEYQGLRDELINKYKIDMRAEERAAEMELEREKLGIQKKEKEAEKAEKAEAKRTAETEKAEAKREAMFNKMQGSLATALDETTPPGRLLTEKKNLVTMGSSLIGAEPTNALLQQALDEAKANRGLSTTIKQFLGMDVKMKPEEQAKVTRRFAELLNTKLEEAPQAPQAPTGLVPMRAPDGRLLQVPANRVAEMEAKGATRE